MTPETLSVVTAIGGLVAAVGGLFAAFAAFRPAGFARAPVEQRTELERRQFIRLVAEAAQKVETEYMRVTAVTPRLKRAYKDLFTFAGHSGGSRLTRYLEEIEESEEEVAALMDEAGSFLTGLKSRLDIPEVELADLLHKFNGYLGRLRVAKEGFRDDLASVERQNEAYRERALNPPVKKFDP